MRSAIASAEKKLGRGGRLIVRPSGTEPVIRVMGEGDDKALVEAVVDDVVEALTERRGLSDVQSAGPVVQCGFSHEAAARASGTNNIFGQ